MLSVSPAFENAINSDAREMTYRVTLNGVLVLDKTVVTNMTLHESMSGSNGLVVGSANAAELTLTLRKPDILEYKGMLVEPESGIVLPDGSTEWVPLGKFWVTNVSTSNDYKTAKLTCADGMYLLSDEYVSNLTYPTSIRAVVHEIISQAGVDFVEPESWPDVVVRVKPEKLTLRSAIGYAAGCCGKNARFNRQGKLEFVWYEDSGITIERAQQYLDGMVKLHDKPLQVNFEVAGEREKYECTVLCGENGSVTATPSKSIYEGDIVSLSVRPDKTYVLASIVATDAFGNEVPLTEDAEGAGYTFIQPDSNVTVTAAFKTNKDGPFKLTVHSAGNGSITYAISDIGHEEGYDYFDIGEEVVLFVVPNEGFAVSNFATIPAGIHVAKIGSSEDGDEVYSFIMPDSDVDITVYFKENTAHSITYDLVHDLSYEPAYVMITNETSGGKTYSSGDSIVIDVSVIKGYELDRVVGNVVLTEIGENSFRFVMPDYDVHLTLYLKQASDENADGTLSFLQPVSYAPPPLEKPYWAVFYEYDISSEIYEESGVNGKYTLAWFDSWSVASGAESWMGKNCYRVTLNGYYACGSKSDANGQHRWDTSVWSGNGAENSSIDLDMFMGRWYTNTCLVATNTNLYQNGKLLFQKNDNALGDVQTEWLVDGVDVREAGALMHWPCPDTYSTPLPGGNWIVVENYYVYKDSEEQFTGYELITGREAWTAVLYFDHFAVTNLGKYWSNRDNDVFRLDFPATTIVVPSGNGDFGSAVTVNEPCYILVEDPSVRNSGGTAAGGLARSTCALTASNMTFNDSGLVYHNNSPIICDCAPATRMFSMRSVYADPVTLTYTNPMIYEKMVPAIQEAMQGMTYTPAKVKHRGNPAFQAGDIVTVPDGNGEYHTVLIMQQTMTFGGGMNSDITCPGQTAETASFSNSSPVSIQIKEEISKTYSDMSHDDSSQFAAIVSAIYSTISSVKSSLQGSIAVVGVNVANVSTEVARIDQRLSLVENSLPVLEGRVSTLETEMSYLEKDLGAVQAAVGALETAMSNAQADIDAINTALTALGETVDALVLDIELLEPRVEALENGVAGLTTRTEALEADSADINARVAALEDKTNLGDLKRQLAETDKQIAHCAEIFMLEVMVNGTEPSAVVLPYDISELHNTRETLRANIAALEVETNE